MAALEIVALNEGANRLQVPGASDTYLLARDVTGNGKSITGINNLTATLITAPIVYTPGAGGTTATRVQAAIDEVAVNALAASTAVYNHALSATAHTAANLVFDPAPSSLVAVRVQAAIDELDAKVEGLVAGSGITNPPNDGKQYARVYNTWVEIVGDGSYPVFSAGSAGLVPDPVTATGKILYDNGWDDLPMPVIYDVFDTTNNGLVPTTNGVAAPTTKFLRADGVWAVPA